MAMVFVDRESAYPNRYRLTDDTGTSSYVFLVRADEPVTPGTPLNAETFNAMLNEVRPIECGGTGANNAETALMNLGGMSAELFWENASPDSSFAEQAIYPAIGLVEGDIVAVWCHNSCNNTFQEFVSFIRVGTQSFLKLYSPTSFRQRTFTAYEGEFYITATQKYHADGTSQSTSDNDYIIPVRMYRIRF